jgi:HEAT repeat protein
MKISLRTDKETVLKLLKNSDIDKKLKIFGSLDQLSENDRVRVLLKVLEDSSWCLREKATRELSPYGAKIVPRLIRICERGIWFSRAAACITLGMIADTRAVEIMVRLMLTDENPTVIREAHQALHKIAAAHPEDFFNQLDGYLKESPDRERFLARLQKINPPFFKLVQDHYHA